MRDRQRILDNLEKLYQDELGRKADPDSSGASRLDFEFQRDQLYLEVLLDLRDVLGGSPVDEPSTKSLLEKAQQLKDLTRLR
jgi:hypothetical protein